MRRQSVDTNVLLRAAIQSGDDQTARARALLADPATTFSVSLLAIAEFVYVLVAHYGRSRAQAGIVTRWLLAIDSLDCQRNVALAALDAYETHPKLSFEDCLLAEDARASRATPLWTFDAKLASQHPAAQLVGTSAS